MTVNYRTFVIANPAAGAGSVKEEWPLIERLLRANLPELDFAFTEGPGHATLLAREALRNGWEMVVSVGGDGTLNEVINGFYDRPDPEDFFTLCDDGWIVTTDQTPTPINPDAVLGLLPMGTGGDFRRTLGLMGGMADNVEHLRGQHTRPIDLGQLAYVDHKGALACRFFINIACAGQGGLVDEYANKSWKGLGGTMSFLVATFRAFIKYKNADLEVRIDDTTEFREKILNLIVANGAYFGGGMWIAPGAQPDDGAFQVVSMGDFTRLRQFKVLPSIYSGTHLSFREIDRYRATEVAARAVDSELSVLLDLDGEQPGQLPARWVIRPGQIKFKI